MKKTKLALIQMKMSSAKEKNVLNAIAKIRLAKKKGASIVCLPELFLTNYFCQSENHSNFNLAESIELQFNQTSSAVSLTPLGIRFLNSQNSFNASFRPDLNPLTWVPP